MLTYLTVLVVDTLYLKINNSVFVDDIFYYVIFVCQIRGRQEQWHKSRLNKKIEL